MKQLTQEQAERCARACGLEPMELNSGKAVWDWSNRVTDNSFGTDELSIKFQFWFPRLYMRLMDMAYFTIENSREWTRVAAYRKDSAIAGRSPCGGHQHPCLALCAAIEALTKEA